MTGQPALTPEQAEAVSYWRSVGGGLEMAAAISVSLADQLDSTRAELAREREARRVLKLSWDDLAKALTATEGRLRELQEALEKIEPKQQEAVEMIRKHGFVFATRLDKKDLTEKERWEKLAFTLYTELCEIQAISAEALVGLPERDEGDERERSALRGYRPGPERDDPYESEIGLP